MPGKAELRGVIFDLDGVLVSTDRMHYASWKRLADELGLRFDEEMNHGLRGVSREESLRVIYRENNVPFADAIAMAQQCARKNAFYVEMVEHMTSADVLPGARELVAGLRRMKIKIGVASASRNCKMVLERTGLGELVDAVVDGNLVVVSKPDPEGFLRTAGELRVPPQSCIGVEDAASGVEAIRRAGMMAIGVGAAAVGADWNVDTIGEITTERMLMIFETRNAI
jgi:beta-phosphoglucomutase